MPLTLAVDCALGWMNLGLADGCTPLGEENRAAGRAQSELLPDAVAGFLGRQGRTLSDIVRIAVTIGPGYYTGIRVGMSYATALAAGLGVCVAPADTLTLLAHGFPPPVVPVVRARRDAVYCAVYTEDSRVPAAEGAFRGVEELAMCLHALADGGARPLLVGADAVDYEALRSDRFDILADPPALGLKLALLAADLPDLDPADVRAAYMRNLD